MDKFGRPEWDTYFMSLALLVSQRSLDKDTKHGTIAIDDDNNILAVGYNGPPRGCIDENVPLNRPDKYSWIVHSEEAAIINAARIGVSLKNSIFYITGDPCEKCFRAIINVGAKKIICGNISSKCCDSSTKEIIKQMNLGPNITIRKLSINEKISQLLLKTNDYLLKKINS